MKDGSKPIDFSTVGKFTIIYVGYLTGKKPMTEKKFAAELNRQSASLVNITQPVVIITFDRVPPVWAVPMVMGRCLRAPMISMDKRDFSKRSCVVLSARNVEGWLIGSCFEQPDIDPAWHISNATKSDRAGRK